MPEPTEWYRSLKTAVASVKSSIGDADSRDYHLDRFLKLALRVDEFAPTCPKCRLLQPEMDQSLRDLGANAPRIPIDQKRKFLGGMETIYTHLKKTHGLISEGQNMGLWLALGTAFGVALGAAIQNPLIGIPIGLALGFVIGNVLDNRAKKASKVI
jgi:hypothetical protein